MTITSAKLPSLSSMLAIAAGAAVIIPSMIALAMALWAVIATLF